MTGATRRRGSGEGSVHQRDDGRWEGRLDLGMMGGKRKRVSVYGRTRREVQDQLRRRQSEHETHGIVDNQRYTVAKWLDHWINNVLPTRVANGTLAQSTMNSYSDFVRRHLIPALGHIRLLKLSAADVDALISSKRDKYSANTLRLMKATLRKALTDAQRAGRVPWNAVTLSEPIRVPKRAQKWLTTEEAKSLLRQVRGDRLEALYVVALSLGLRRGEALALRWEDFDFDAATLLIRRAIKRVGTGSDAGRRTRLEVGFT